MTLTDESKWISFFQVDILQTISVTLMILLLIVVLTRSEKLFLSMSMVVMLFFIFAAPLIREMDLTSLPIWLRPYFTTQFKSQFPLFPWSGFLIGGMLIGHWFLEANVREPGSGVMKRIGILAMVGILLSLTIEIIPVAIYQNHNFWRASPEFFFVRFGIIMLLLVALWRREQHRLQASRPYLSLFGKESLLVYVVHLLIVYGYTYEFSFIRRFGPTLNYVECFWLFVALTVAMYILAYAWHWMKGWNKLIAGVVEVVTLASIVIAFILKD
jgi:uncharacterized membrane protein